MQGEARKQRTAINPVPHTEKVAYAYTVPRKPQQRGRSCGSSPAATIIFTSHYSRQISGLTPSVAPEETALGAIAGVTQSARFHTSALCEGRYFGVKLIRSAGPTGQ